MIRTWHLDELRKGTKMIIKGHRDAVSQAHYLQSMYMYYFAFFEKTFHNNAFFLPSSIKAICVDYTSQITVMAASDESLFSASRDMTIRSWNPDDGTQKCIVEVWFHWT